jgi:THO complex subunit 2
MGKLMIIMCFIILDLEFSDDLEGSNCSLNASSDSVKAVPGQSSNSERSSLIRFVSFVVHQSKYLPFSLLLERLEPEFLQAIEVVASADLFNKKVIKINTAMFYRQQKFNLLREESEGFSRLIILIGSSINFGSCSSEAQIDLLYDRILEMIGFFDLDPIKVLDILLECFVFGLTAWREFLQLLRKFSFPSASIVGVLGFKLAFIREDSKFTCEYLEKVFTVIGHLLSQGFFDLSALWPHLLPSDSECLEEFEKLKMNIRESGAKIGVVNLSSSSNVNSSTAASDLSPESLTEHFAQDTLNTKLIPSLCYERNLKAHLLLALLSIGSSDLAHGMLAKYPHLAYLNHKISKQICAVIESLLDVDKHADIFSWLNLLPNGGLFYSPRLFSKLVRNLSTSKLPESFIQTHLFPALSCSSHDSLILSQELWEHVVSPLPYAERYSLYGGWLENFSVDSNVMIYAPLIRANSIGEARKVMRRLAKENVRQYGRLVSKVIHSNPIIVLPLILDQLQAYDNIIPAVIDAFRYLTPMSFDVLIFCLLRALSSPERDRLKEDGTNIAAWLQNLAQFSACIFRKFPQTLHPAPLLRYIYSQLLDDNCLDIVVLQDLLAHMAAIEKPENVSEILNEVRAAGGPVLIQEIRKQQVISTGHAFSRRAVTSLKGALEAENLSLSLLVALAQASDAVIYRMDYSHLKLISTLTDMCHSAFLQYLDYLKSDNVIAELGNSLNLDIENLVKVKGLELPVALLIAKSFNLDFTCESLVDLFRFYHADKDLELFVPGEFLKTFWSLDLKDISVPLSRYQVEIARLQGDCTAANRDSIVAELQQEMKEQVGKFGKIREGLVQEKDKWFTNCRDRAGIVNSVMKMALLPRIMLGPMEAQFCAKFLFLLHSLGAPHFSTLSLLDSIFDGLCGNGTLLSSLTEAESHCFGRFVHECLVVLQSWHLTREKYEREAVALHLPGFMKRWSYFLGEEVVVEVVKDSASLAAEETDTDLPSIIIENFEEGEVIEAEEEGLIESKSNGESVVYVDENDREEKPKETSASNAVENQTNCTTCNPHALNWEDFRHVLYKWHDKLFSSVLNLLKSEDYGSIRNCVIFLSHLSGGTFPRLENMSDRLEEAILKIKAEESREDLKVLATRYSAMLIQNKPKLVKEHEFHLCENLSLSTLKLTTTTETNSKTSSPSQSGNASSSRSPTPDRKRGASTPTSGTNEKRPKLSERERRSDDRRADNKRIDERRADDKRIDDRRADDKVIHSEGRRQRENDFYRSSTSSKDQYRQDLRVNNERDRSYNERGSGVANNSRNSYKDRETNNRSTRDNIDQRSSTSTSRDRSHRSKNETSSTATTTTSTKSRDSRRFEDDTSRSRRN